MTPRRASRDNSNAAGSPPTGEPAFLAVGKLRRPHGVKGEMLMDILTDFPERLKAGVTVYAGPQHRPLRLRSARPQDQTMLVAFNEYTTPEAAGELRNQIIYVHAAGQPPLEEGEYYHHQILGLRVVDEGGQPLGIVKEILETGANDVYVVQRPDGPEILLPVIDPVILNVDLEKGEIRVHVIPGLLSDEQQ